MLVYHGSYCEVIKPDFSVGRKKLDFGAGFYTTTKPQQAEQWAIRKAYESELQLAIVSVYEYNEDNDLTILCFSGYDKEWLEFVVKNRRSGFSSDQNTYDLIIGGVADDRVIDTINYYIGELVAGRDSEELVNLTLKQLSYQKPNDQICFYNQKALKYLSFKESYEVQK